MSLVRRILGHLVTCKETSRLLSQAQDAPLPRFTRLRLSWHIAVCRACAGFERQLRTLGAAMRRYRE